MRLQIFDSILNGSIPINCNNDIPNYDKIAYLFSVEAKDKSSAEQTLAQILNGRLTLDFSIQDEADINVYIGSVSYTPIPSDYASVSVPIVLTDRTTHERYFKALLRLESARIKFALIDYANTVKDNQRTGNEVSQTIKAIGKLASQAEEEHRLGMHPDLNHDYEDCPEFYDNIAEPTSRIYKNYITTLTALYLELSIMFEEILSPSSYLSLDDFYSRRLNNRPVPDDIRYKYEVARQLHRTQVALRSNDIEQIQAVLVRNYEVLPKIKSKQFAAETAALENHLFTLIYTGDTEINEPLSRTDERRIVAELSNKFKSTTIQISNTREIVNLIDSEKQNLSFFADNSIDIKSVPRDYLSFLKEQEKLYAPHLADALMTTSTPKSIMPIKKVNKSVSAKIKNALKHIGFMSGDNEKGQKIMSDDDYAQLQQFITEFYQTGEVPNVPSRLYAHLPNDFITYTFYLIMQDNDPGRDKAKRMLYVQFVHDVFSQLRNTDVQTLYRKFATKPSFYDRNTKH